MSWAWRPALVHAQPASRSRRVVRLLVGWVVGDAAPDAWDALCLAHVARFKRPKRYVFIAELPKNAYSKVLKTVLRQQLTLESPA